MVLRIIHTSMHNQPAKGGFQSIATYHFIVIKKKTFIIDANNFLGNVSFPEAKNT